ncbi:MAG: glycosyltransferase family 2 protein [Anaerolineae bacterium]|nr:glycosyltransferase family 2 protein [Anaerolineae bacterium]
MPRLSVVIVNYNTRDLLRACLQSLMQQTLPQSDLEVIVVDNASSDGSAAMVIETFPQVTLLAQTENTWFCGGNNIGIRAATGGTVLLLNPDTVVAEDALAILLDFAESHPDYAGCTAQMRYPDGSIQRTCSRIPTLAYLFVKHTPLTFFAGWRKQLDGHHWYSEWDRESDHDVEVIPGSCTLMRRKDILLDDELLLYFPEDDLAQRIKRPFHYLTAAQITHHEKAATQNWNATRIYYRDLLVYVRKHHGWLAMALLWAMSRPLYGGMWLKKVLTA